MQRSMQGAARALMSGVQRAAADGSRSMGTQPLNKRFREVTYSLSPNQVDVLPGLFRGKAAFWKQFVKEEWLNVAVFSTILFGPILYADWYNEREKMHHRF
ncbi:unnamed protein product [Pedinophyceae sp. YPF-701]|nr:unnamed protein product [Pedinophyceae sp. YPF-701]